VRIDIGPARPDELGFVLATWKDSAIDAPHNGPVIADRGVGYVYGRLNVEVDTALSEGALVLVAREATDPTFIYGWIAGRIQDDLVALYYLYTRHKFRRQGVARALRDEALRYVPDDARLVQCIQRPREEDALTMLRLGASKKARRRALSVAWKDEQLEVLGFTYAPLAEVLLSLRRTA
jgi:GNAT superfamily N-acetyltransferase